MKVTFDEYISNPMGKKNSVLSNRDMFRQMYTEKLDAILVRESGKIKYTLYYNKSKDEYYIHFKMPSEKLKDFYYDTVIQFYTDKHECQLSSSLKGYYVRFYSNDPSFIYTFAHAMKSNDMFIKDLESKMSKIALKQVAVDKNPKDEVGYVKSIFFAYLLMKNYNLFSKSLYRAGERYSSGTLRNRISHADDKLAESNQKIYEENKKKKLEKAQAKVVKDELDDIDSINSKLVRKTKTVNKTPRTKAVVRSRNSNKVKKIKKI